VSVPEGQPPETQDEREDLSPENRVCHLVSISPTPPRASPVWRISHRHACSAARATSAAVAAPAVDDPPIATTWAGAPCTTSATCAVAGHSTCASSTPSTAVTAAGAASWPTCPTWPRRGATTPTGSSLCPYAWWRKTGYPTGRPPGISGATTASLSPTPRSRTGSKRRGKKRRRAGRGQPPGLGLG
jgi:hypothetical protein